MQKIIFMTFQSSMLFHRPTTTALVVVAFLSLACASHAIPSDDMDHPFELTNSNLRHRALGSYGCGSPCKWGSGNCKNTLTGQCWSSPQCGATPIVDCSSPDAGSGSADCCASGKAGLCFSMHSGTKVCYDYGPAGVNCELYGLQYCDSNDNECECSHDSDCPADSPFCGASDGSFMVGRGECKCYKCIRDTYPSGLDTGCPEHLPKCAGQAFDIPDCVGGTVCVNPDNWSSSPSAEPSVPPSSHPSAQPSSEPSVSPSAAPSSIPSAAPSFAPSSTPSTEPSLAPSTVPSSAPSLMPSSMPQATSGVLWCEDFESTPVDYTTSTAEFTDGDKDYFMRTDGSNIPSSIDYTNLNGFYFAANDINGEGAASQQTISWSGIDIYGATDLWFCGDFAEDDASDGNEDYDAPDFVHVDYQLDGSSLTNLLHFENTGETFNTVAALDTDFDGVGDGTVLTPFAQTFCAPITGTGSTLDLTITLDLDAGDEDIAFDNLKICFGGKCLLSCIDEQGVIWCEDFESTPVDYTTSTAEFTDGDKDYFMRTDGSNIPSSIDYTNLNGFYFAANDINGEGAASQQTISWSGIDISGATDLCVCGDFAEDDASDGNEDYDAPDFVHVDYQLDGSSLTNLLHFENTGETFNTVAALDTDFDGVGDGTVLTPEAQTFCALITGTGSTLDLTITLDLGAGDEDIAFDNLKIFSGGFCPVV